MYAAALATWIPNREARQIHPHVVSSYTRYLVPRVRRIVLAMETRDVEKMVPRDFRLIPPAGNNSIQGACGNSCAMRAFSCEAQAATATAPRQYYSLALAVEALLTDTYS